MVLRVPDETATRAGAGPVLGGRDLELLAHLDAGRSTSTIAAGMSISTNTVRTRIRRLQGRLAVTDRSQVVDAARDLGVL
jgi:DNA-binding NarL/FixJ family response regulator